MTTAKKKPRPPAERSDELTEHLLCGNCWAPEAIHDCRRCGSSSLCDVCHLHDYPRGECEDCDRCEACDAEDFGGSDNP